MSNPYIKTPLYVAQIDPTSGNYIAAYFFLGNIPKIVLNAANSYIPNTSDPRKVKWESKNAIILEKFYGKGWKKLLTPENPIINESVSDRNDIPLFFSYTGGGRRKKKLQDDLQDDGANLQDDGPQDDDADLQDKDDLQVFENDEINKFFDNNQLDENEELDNNIKLFDDSGHNVLSDYSLTIAKKIKSTVYLPISVYPEDTIYDLRLKIHLATNIEFYRQHIFYYVNGEGPAVPYQFNVDNIPIYINYKDLYKKDNTLCGIHIDSALEKRKDGIQIKAMDTFIPLQIANGVRINAIYFIDLYNILAPLDYPHRPIDNLPQILKDKYQFNVLYYGALIKYWPQLSLDIMNIALSYPKNMNKYISLAHNLKYLSEKFATEQYIAEGAIQWNKYHSIYMAGEEKEKENKKENKKEKESKKEKEKEKESKKDEISITGATIKVYPKSAKVRCLIRNIFDWLETNNNIIMINAKFDIESALLSESGMALVSIDERQGEFISISGIKRYASSQDPKYINLTNWFINNKVESNTMMIAIVRKNIHASWSSPFIYLTLYSTGQYTIAGEWAEDDKIKFSAIIKELTNTINPLIEKINLMGVAAFPSGGEFYAINSDKEKDAILGNITGSVFYQKYFSDTMFKELRKKMKSLENANIIKFKNIQNSEIILFSFLKGIISYNLKLADRAESATFSESTSNQYAWLSNVIVANRWAISFSGRIVKIYHRATDIKIEIINADNINEFNLIKSYILAFIDSHYNKYNLKKESVSNSDKNNKKDKKKLKKLQENDPNLFDLKKYNPKNKVYSVLCQSDRQPFSYTESEMKQLTEKQKNRLVKYWNFTENTPAYYECPHVKFPHLSFRPDQHPLGYCLPCCNMSLPPINSKSAKTYSHCLAHKKGDIIKTEEISKHILSYGKSIQVGRVSEIGREISDELFLGQFELNNKLYLIGVDQHLPSIHDAGFTYSILYLIKEKDKTINDQIKEIALFVRNMKDNFYHLGNGSGMLYNSSDDLADDIINIFIHKMEMTSILEKSGEILSRWRYILLDLVEMIYGLNIVIFKEDEDNEFSVEIAKEFIDGNDIIFLLSNNTGIYPVIMTNIKIYLKTISNFLPTEDICIRKFTKNNKGKKIYNIISSMLISSNIITISPILDIETIIKKTEYKIKSLFINFKNYCYGLLIEGNNCELYLPIEYSSYFSYTKYNIIFDPISIDNIPSLDTIRKFISISGLNLNPGFNLINHKKKYIGFKSNHLCYFFQESDIPYDESLNNIYFPYSVLDINTEIIKYIKGKSSKEEVIKTKYKKALMRNRLYKYFVAEFSSILRNDKNTSMRKKIISLLVDIKFDDSNSLTQLRIKLIKLLHNYPSDLILLKEIISKSFLISIYKPLHIIINYINSTLFDFDKQLLYNLKSLDHNSLIKELKNLMNKNIKINNNEEYIKEPSNLYISCSEKSLIDKSQCYENRLIIPMDIAEDFYHILAMDIKNPIKTKLLSSLSAGIFDSMDFIKRENEILDIFIEN